MSALENNMRYQAHADAIADGIVEAWKTYYSWSRQCFVHHEAIEAFLSVKVAEQLFQSFPDTCRVRIEPSITSLALDSCAEGTRGRKPADMRVFGRVDVAFYDKAGYPKGVVELKKKSSASVHSSDTKRIVRLLDRIGSVKHGSLRWGAIAAMHTMWDSNRSTLETKMANMVEKLEAVSGGRTLTSTLKKHVLAEPIKEDGGFFLGCAGVCVMIS